MFNVNQIRKGIKPFIIASVCFVPFALSINLLSWQYKLVSGGFPGYGLVVNYLTGFSVGIFLLIINTLVLFLNFIFVGKTAGIKGVYGYVWLSFLIDFTRKYMGLTQHLNTPFLFNTLVLSFQGLVAGSLIGVIIFLGYSFGSYSSLVLLVNKLWKIAPPPFFFLMDFVLAIITAYFFGIDRALLLLINATLFFIAFNYTLKFSREKVLK